MISATRYSSLAEINRQTELAKEMAQLQQSVSSGNRLTAPSDDPAASARIADIRQTQADQLVWSRNADTGASIASAADTTLTSVGSLLDRAKDLVLSARNDTTSAADRSSIAAELRGLATDLDTYAQQSDPTGRPLFPDGTPISLPVSSTSSLPATASRDSVFGGITTSAGPQSLSDILNAAADALETTDDATRATAIDDSIAAIGAGVDHITQVRADQGIRAQRFDSAKDALTSSGDQLTEEKSGLAGTDLTYAVAEFQSKQLSLQAAQTIYAQGMKSSLFDLLG